jgi:glutamyl-tRNA reductase
MPRDVAPDVADLTNVHLQDIDNLQEQADENLQSRQAAIPQVEQIITESVVEFTQWLASTAAKSTITDLRQQAEQLRQGELERLFNKLDLNEKERNLVATMSHRFMNKLLHQPTLRLKQEAAQSNGPTYIAATRQLFALDG